MAEYIDLLQLDVARNKKYRMDAEVRQSGVMGIPWESHGAFPTAGFYD